MNISDIKTNNQNPNLTIVLPGPCQAKCGFCNWKQDDKIGKFIISLQKLLENIPSNFRQISISGGEPTLSPVFTDVIEMLGEAKKVNKIDKVVLTTNGVKLDYDDKIHTMTDVVDFINISRHHYKDSVNSTVFGTKNIPDTDELKWIITSCNKAGIEVNFNCVFNKHNEDFNVFELKSFIDLAKSTGATSIAFRNQYDDFESSVLQGELELSYKAKSEQSSPVCMTKTFIVDGMSIKFHHSSYEPTESTAFDTDETYELILHGNGVLSRDWEGLKIVNIDPVVKDLNNDDDKVPPPKPYGYTSCTAERILGSDRSGNKYTPTYSECGQTSYSSC